MEKTYKNINYFFVVILLLVFVGFFKSYFGLFPSFKGLPIMAHLHATAFLFWFALLIVQPILIKTKRLKLHKLLGKSSYFIIPMLVFTSIGMLKLAYERDLKVMPKPEVLGGLLFTFLDLTLLLSFYLLAIFNSHNLALHIRFMVATSIVILVPGIGRLYFQLFGQTPAIILTISTVYIILIGLMLFDKIKLKIKIFTNPYLIVLGMFLLEHITYFTIPESKFWQFTAEKIVSSIFY